MTADPQPFRTTDSDLPESIFWDDRRDELVWVDITTGTVHRAGLDGPVDGRADRLSSLPAPASAIQPAADGGYVAALKDSIVLLDSDCAIVRTIATVTHRRPDTRFNEGKIDPFGRFVVGAMDVSSDPDAGLYVFDPDGGVTELRGGFGTTNGMEWSDSGDVMYVTDTSDKTVYRAPYGADGVLGQLEPFLVGRSSDGLAMDAEGGFWNGINGDGEVIRWSPDGTFERAMAIPAPGVTSVAFGGSGYGTLFVATARENLSESELAEHPFSGGLLRIDGVATGRPPHTFGA